MDEPLDFHTRAIHAGKDHNPTLGLTPPIYQTSTFRFPSAKEGAELMQTHAPELVYTRWGNPNAKQVEATIASLEGGEAALVFGSGMGAVSAAIFAHLAAGDHAVLGTALYSGTTEVARSLLPRYGVEVSFVEAFDLEKVRQALRKNTRLILVETPTNPTLEICDLEGIARIGKEAGVLTMADNTFASPVNQNPLAHGIDVVLHSMTKYIGGHSDLTAGVVVGKKEAVERCWTFLKLFGACLSPFEAWLLIRGLKTLALRVERQNRSAHEVARFLAGHPAIERVYYPGLPTHPRHQLAGKQMRGFGGMVSFELRGGAAAGARLVDAVRLITLAVSLGGAESLIVHPASTTHGMLSDEALKAAGLTPGLLRLSVGLEDPRDIIKDLQQAIEKSQGS
jgi:methionine-gamma-lyase